MDSLFAGACAGMLSRTCSAPFERLKILGQCSSEPIDYIEEFKRIHKRDGPRAFWRGNMTNCISIAPNSAIQFLMFDLLNKYSSRSFKSDAGCEQPSIFFSADKYFFVIFLRIPTVLVSQIIAP
jgi:hypothetical protein